MHAEGAPTTADEAAPEPNELAAVEAELRTVRRLAWCAFAEALIDPSQSASSLEELLGLVGLAIQSRAQEEWDDDTWETFVKEVQQSMHYEMVAREWRRSTWSPRLQAKADATSCNSIWSWSWALAAEGSGACTEEQQLLWEVAASFDGHMTHPCAKTKIGLTPHALVRTAPEFEPVVPLPVAAIASVAVRQFRMPEADGASEAESNSVSAYFEAHFPACHARWAAWLRSIDEPPEKYVPLPVHPANLRQLTGDLGVLLESGLLLLPSADAGALLAQPLLSLRTLLPLQGGGDGGAAVRGITPPYIKLPVPLQITSLRRYLSPVEAAGGPLLSSVVMEAVRREEERPGSGGGGRLHVLAEECAVHLEAPGIAYERARYVSAMYRRNIASLPIDFAQTNPMPLAAIFSQDPLTERPVLLDLLGAAGVAADPAEAARWYESHCTLVIGTLLPLWLSYGITLEMHQQNCVLLMGKDGRLKGLVCREVSGGTYCWENLLVANGFDIRSQLHPRQDAVFAEPQLPLDVFFHTNFISHLLPLADALSACVPGVSSSVLLESVRRAISANLRQAKKRLEERTLPPELRAPFDHVIALTEHCWLRARTVRIKSLLLMRALGTKSELFSEATNPLLRQGGEGKAETASARARKARMEQGKGRITTFPLSCLE